MEPEVQQQYLFSLAKRLVHVRSQREPAVLLFEDLHWFDPVSEAFVETLAAALPGTRTLLLVNFRPEYNGGWMQYSYYQRLPLRALGSEAIRELLDELLGSDPSLANLPERIQTHSGGNPFFIEEIVQSLVEAGSLRGTKAHYRLVEPVERITLPGTVQALLTARIDRLSAPDKHVLQAAAVVGKTFSEPVLTRAVEDAQLPVDKSLRSLLGAEFIYQDALYPYAQYAFKHPLTHEVAYHAQLAEQRARLHAAVAQAVIELNPSRLDEQAALLAHHWQQAGEALEAARWSRRAAEWVGLRDVREASRHWRAVRTLLEDAPESEEKTALRVAACVGTLECGWRVGLTEQEAATVFEEGKRAAEQCGDVLALTRLLNVYGVIRGLAGEVEEYLAHAAEGLELAQQTGDPAHILLGYVTFVYACYVAGKMREALTVTERAIEAAPEDPRLRSDPLEFRPYLWLVMFRGALLVYLGRLGEVRDQLDRSLQLARECGETEIVGWIHINNSGLARISGDLAGTVDQARRAVEVAEKAYTPFSRMLAYNALGSAYVASSDWDEAVRASQISLEIAQQSRTGLFAEGYVLASLAEAYAGRGDEQLARATAEKAVTATRERRTRLFECVAHIAFARVLLKCDGRQSQARIEQALTRAQVLVEETGARSYEPSIRVERAELARLVGDEAGRERELGEAQRLFAEISAAAYAEQPSGELR